jgi:hypothetical protein
VFEIVTIRKGHASEHRLRGWVHDIQLAIAAGRHPVTADIVLEHCHLGVGVRGRLRGHWLSPFLGGLCSMLLGSAAVAMQHRWALELRGIGRERRGHEAIN